jgi:AraC family transcriptional regulator
MGRLVRVVEGRFGRLLLTELGADESSPPEQEIQFLNPAEIRIGVHPSRQISFHAAVDWLRAAFPAVFEDQQPFPHPRETITPRIRQLADTMAVELINDRFLSAERLEFMLQELVLSIVDTYVARRRASSALWRGSRFEDSRIRRAIALLRAHPNKDLSMDEVATQVGLSRSRFYDLFQLCTGHSPRAYLDMLCVETAIAKLSSGRGKIAELAAELGFSAQSNFTRFFLNQVGVPPSEYRRAASVGEKARDSTKDEPAGG